MCTSDILRGRICPQYPVPSTAVMHSFIFFSARRLQRGWRVQGSTVTFDPEQVKATRDLPAKELISNALTYARELERIV